MTSHSRKTQDWQPKKIQPPFVVLLFRWCPKYQPKIHHQSQDKEAVISQYFQKCFHCINCYYFFISLTWRQSLHINYVLTKGAQQQKAVVESIDVKRRWLQLLVNSWHCKLLMRSKRQFRDKVKKVIQTSVTSCVREEYVTTETVRHM